MSSTYYPQSPDNVDIQLTSLTSSYQMRALMAIFSILLFFLLYTALVVGLAYLVKYAIIYDMGRVNKFTLLMKGGAIAGAVMLFLFTLKFIFKLKNHVPENRIKLKKEENEHLWNFVIQICNETGAPRPKSIYVDPDVNAYVSYTNSWLSLFLPVKKDLTIGLGLVSCVNLSEFKAVVAHEFGHFAQSSMKIGSYIMSANTIIHDMIYSRDKWDDTLDTWRASDFRLSAAAWVITPIIWLIRRVLSLFYQFLNIMYSSLSREMEFNADKVAVSTSGSDAIISALWKLDDGFSNWNNTLNNAYIAGQKKMFSKNLYEHNNQAIERNTKDQIQKLNNLPNDERGGKRFFSNSNASLVSMYASHPSNDKREANAKIPYIECPTDERSPWILFNAAESLQKEMTSLVYQHYFAKTPSEHATVEQFEQFIAAETIGRDLLEEYHNTFEHRFLSIPSSEELHAAADRITDHSVNQLDKIKSDLLELMRPIQEIQELMSKAVQISQGATTQTSFTFNGKTFGKKKIELGYNELTAERERLFAEKFTEWDKQFCAFHLSLAKKIDKNIELSDLYIQHAAITKFFKSISHLKQKIYFELEDLQNREDVEQIEVNTFGHRVSDLVMSLNTELDALEEINFVPLSNIDTVAELRQAIIDDGSFKKEKGPIFENGGFNRILLTLDNAISHCQRIDQKSISSILLKHQELHEGI